MCNFTPPQPVYRTSPTPDPSAASANATPVSKDQAKVQSEQEKERFRLAASSRGLASTILTSGLGDTTPATVRRPQLGA